MLLPRILVAAASMASVHVDEIVRTAPGVHLRVLTRGRDESLPLLVYTPFAWTFPALHSGDRIFMQLQDTFLLTSYDPRGVGASANSSAPTSSADFVDDVVGVAQYVRRRFGKRKVYALGISTGGTFVARAAQRAPDLFYHVVADGPTINATEQYENSLQGVEDIWRVPKFVSRHMLPMTVFGSLVMLRLPFHECRTKLWCTSDFFTPLTFMFSDLYKHGASVFVQAALALGDASRLEDASRYGLLDQEVMRYEAPITFVAGQYDAYLANVATLKRYVRAINANALPSGAGHADLVVIPNASHALHIEQTPAFLSIVRSVASMHLMEDERNGACTQRGG